MVDRTIGFTPSCDQGGVAEGFVEMIYYVLCRTTNVVKIGSSVDVWRRFTAYETHSPTKLEIVAIEPGDRHREKELHILYSEYRTRGEWFSYTGRLYEYIASLDVPETPEALYSQLSAASDKKRRESGWKLVNIWMDKDIKVNFDILTAIHGTRDKACSHIFRKALEGRDQ